MEKSTSIYLDIIRIVTALTVCLGHLGGKLTGGLMWQLNGYLHCAVMVFFVLSGYVISHVVNTKEKELADYTVARIARLSSVVIPALIITIISDFIGLSINKHAYIDGPWVYPEGNQALNYVLSFFLLQNVWSLNLEPGINHPFWSLSYELLYYSIFAAFVFLKGKKRVIVLILLLTLAGQAIIEMLPIWLLGVLCYEVHKAKISFLHSNVAIIISIFFFLMIIYMVPVVRESIPEKIPFLLTGKIVANYFDAIMFFLHLLFCLPLTKKLYTISQQFKKQITFMSSLSFPMYLFHRPLQQVFFAISFLPPTSFITRLLVIVCPLTIVVLVGQFCDKWKILIKKTLEKYVFRQNSKDKISGGFPRVG